MRNFSKIFLVFLVIFLIAFAFSIKAQNETPPVGTITAPAAVRANEIFNITISGQDDVGMGYVCYKEENDINWTCYECIYVSLSCIYDFERSETVIGNKYKYFGYVEDVAGNSSFTDPESVTVQVQADPRVATVSVVNLQATQATLEGYVLDLGGADAVEVWFEYGLTSDYGGESQRLVRNGPGFFNITIDNLEPATVYHFRAVAENGVATAFGDDMVTTELIRNPGFETGTLDGWQMAESGHYRATDGTEEQEEVYEGEYSGLFGFKDFKGSGRSAFYQTVSIPEVSANITLSADYNFYTYDYCPYDAFRIRLRDADKNILRTYEDWCCPSGRIRCRRSDRKEELGWQALSEDLADYAGQTVIVSFEVWRSDDDRHAWSIIDNISLTYIHTFPPLVETRPAEGVHTGSAILIGNLVDMGQADWVDVWFVWDEESHENWQDYENQTGVLRRDSAGEFVISVGNLVSDTTYYFRVVAENNSGLDFGEEKNFKTFVSAAGNWRLPDSHIDVNGCWQSPFLAYDWDTATRSLNGQCPRTTGYRGFLEFYLNEPLLSDKIRVSGAGGDSPSGSTAHIQIRYIDSDWITIFDGDNRLPENHRFVEVEYEEGLVEAGRFRIYYPIANWASSLGEFQFYQIPEDPIAQPTVHTEEAVKIEENSAILKGVVSDDGGEPAKSRFKYWPADAPEDIMYTGWDMGISGHTTGWATGEVFGRMITGLEEGQTYHFRAQLKNSASDPEAPAEGAIKSFTTAPAPVGWVSPISSGGTWGDYEHYAYDDVEGTFLTRSRTSDDPTWSSWLEFYRTPISSNEIRFRVPNTSIGGDNSIEQIQVQVRLAPGAWSTVFDSSVFNRSDWTEFSFSERNIDEARIRLRMRANNYTTYEVDEFEFWKLPDPPRVETGEASVGIEDEELKVEVSGRLLYTGDTGGTVDVNVWFEWREEGEPDYDSSGIISPTNSPGEFWEEIAEYLIFNNTYYFRIVAENIYGRDEGEEVPFATPGTCTPFVEEAYCVCRRIVDEVVCEIESAEGGVDTCSYRVECTEDGFWPRCDGDCATDDCCDCDVGEVGDAYCDEDCLCNYDNCGIVLQPPTDLWVGWNHCDYIASIPSFYWTPDPNATQTARHIQINGSSLDEIFSGPATSYALINVLDYLNWAETYSWWVRTSATELESGDDPNDPDSWEPWSDWSEDSFTMPIHAYPYPDFTASPPRLVAGEIVRFDDESKCYSFPDNEEKDCIDLDLGARIEYQWDFDYDGTSFDPDSYNKGNTTTTYNTHGDYRVRLKVFDADLNYFDPGNNYCPRNVDIRVTLPLPEYREVRPRSQLDNFLARYSSVFTGF